MVPLTNTQIRDEAIRISRGVGNLVPRVSLSCPQSENWGAGERETPGKRLRGGKVTRPNHLYERCRWVGNLHTLVIKTLQEQDIDLLQRYL